MCFVMSLAFSDFDTFLFITLPNFSAFLFMCNSFGKEVVRSVGHGPCVGLLLERTLEKWENGWSTRCEND